MQSYSLTVDKFLDHASVWFGESGVTQAVPGEPDRRVSYAEIRPRANRLSGALLALGLEFGDRVGTLAWNTLHHLELYYATMGTGLVCHTLNPRLTAAQIAAIVNEAEDRVLAVALDLLPLAQELTALCPGLEHVIVLDGTGASDALGCEAQVWNYEELLAAKGAPAVWGAFDENTPAGLCYTSGTSGVPKGVLYTHRSNYLHTLRSLQADGYGTTARDVILLAAPMFHANGWGVPFTAPAVGARLVFPGRRTDGESLYRLMREESVTLAVGVPTVWVGLLDYLDREGGDLPALERVLVGGSTAPAAFVRRLETRLGARVQASWGMTELSPLGTIASLASGSAEDGHSGRPLVGIELKLTDAEGVPLPQQRGATGHLHVRGASVIDRYFKAEQDAVDADGWFATGDLASIDEAGNLTICGRSKDLIKSGGEWINPNDIEAIVGADPSVGAVAVVGRFDPKWDERPVLVVQARNGHAIDPDALLQLLRGKVADWWIPDEVAVVAAMPLAATGKIDKTRLREQVRSGEV
jgi:acyl-CoA synthetase (AMP-forming)/AMP-acid ligase II